MCNYCHCSEMDKCSVKGYAPFGWCCDLCEEKDSEKGCKKRFSIKIVNIISDI